MVSAILLAALVAGVASAPAEDYSSAADEAASYVPGWASLSQLEQLAEEPHATALPDPPVNSEAADELPHENLDREEAIDLASSVFGDLLQEPTAVFEDLNIRAFRSDHVAVVESETAPSDGSAPQLGLVSSMLPLRTDGDEGAPEPVALELDHEAGEFQPQNPLVEVGIPSDLDDGISLPESDISIDIVGAADRAASNLDEVATFYPNVAPESDLVVAPTATGVETFAHLRSPDAPSSQIFRLQLPTGAELTPAPDGGAVVTSGDLTLLRVRPPSGIDANGDPVPVDLEVSGGDSIIVRASPTATSAYPLLIDPVFESYDWYQTKVESPEWKSLSSPCMIASWAAWMLPGLKMYSCSYSPVTPGAIAQWAYYVPRFFTDMAEIKSRPTTYIKKLTLSKLSFAWSGYSPQVPQQHSPYLVMGIWSEPKNQFVSFGQRTGPQGPLTDPNYQYVFTNPDEVTDATSFGIALTTIEGMLPAQRDVVVEQAAVELSDKDSPQFGYLEPTPAWVNASASSPVEYSVGDLGLGIHDLQITQPALGPGFSKTIETPANCLGTVSKPCSRVLNGTQRPLVYDPSTMPQGENWVTVTARDPVIHPTSKGTYVKVDHSKPTIDLSGTLTEQAKVGTTAAQYVLKYSARDGDNAPPAPLPEMGTHGTGIGQMQSPWGIAIDPTGNSFVVDRECKCVQKYDAQGKFLQQFGSPGTADGQFSDSRGIAIGSEGVWVADRNGKRLQLFSLSGTFIRKLTNNQFVEPMAVAVGPGNALWVADAGSDKLFKFQNATGTPTVVSSSGQHQIQTPTGIAVDSSGRVWTTDESLHRVNVYNSSGQWLFQFGSLGSGPNQFFGPTGITIAPVTENILVADLMGRVREFRSNGEFIRQTESAGTGSGDIQQPRGMALGGDGVLYIASPGSGLVARRGSGTYDPQSGVTKASVTVDGSVVDSATLSCGTSCETTREWTLKADQLSVGQHSVAVSATDAVGLVLTKTFNVETHGDLKPPAIALSGPMTEQATLGNTRPSYRLDILATDPGSAEERQSGATTVVVKVDGVARYTAAPGCPAGGCSISRSWTLNSNSYSPGAHTVQVTATDGAGRTTTKGMSITITRDTTPPEIVNPNSSNALFNAPEGWVEQDPYSYLQTATDADGYGVTTMTMKVDGTTVANKFQTCAAGACGASLSGSLNMANYDGGAHPVEVIATDGAGNIRKRNVTINVDPSGQIAVSEAEDTLEALEATTDLNAIGPAEEEEGVDGTSPDLGLSAVTEGIETTGTAVPGRVATEADEGMALKIIGDEAFTPTCDEQTATESQEGVCIALGDQGELDLEEIVIEPVSPDPDAGEAELIDDVATVTTNVENHVDTIMRPLFDGAMSFQVIRDAAAPEAYSWRVRMSPDQELVAMNPQTAGVFYGNGRLAFTITATAAHDAIGSTVQTSLSVDGDDGFTLTVHHRNPSPAGGSFVYPVTAGTGWEGGFHTYEIAMPPAAPTPKEEEEGAYGEIGGILGIRTYGPPTPQAATPAIEALGAHTIPTYERRFKFVYCKGKEIPGSGGVKEIPPGNWNRDVPAAISECNNPEHEGIWWKTSTHGRYHYKVDEWVWVEGFNDSWCDKGDQPMSPAKVGCILRPLGADGPQNAVHTNLEPIGKWVFDRESTDKSWEFANRKVCFREGGRLKPKIAAAAPEPAPTFSGPPILEYSTVTPAENCDWSKLHQLGGQ